MRNTSIFVATGTERDYPSDFFGAGNHTEGSFVPGRALARAIAAQSKARFITIARERRSQPFTEEQLTAMRGGLTAEEYRWKIIRKWQSAAKKNRRGLKERSPTNG